MKRIVELLDFGRYMGAFRLEYAMSRFSRAFFRELLIFCWGTNIASR